MKKTRIVFMGTPYFAQKVLESLINENYNVIAVVSQPDKPVGRKQLLEKNPVKQLAEEKGILVIQPFNLRKDHQTVLDLDPELIITCAYGQFIPKALLDHCLNINIHASLLPLLRGGAPMHHAIIGGHEKTGITIMRMAPKMDAGDMIVKQEVEIRLEDTVGSLQDRLIACATSLLIKTLPAIIRNDVVYTPQNEAEATFGYNISKEEEFISFDRPYRTVYDHIRGLIPWPVGYGMIDETKVKFHKVRHSEISTDEPNGTLVGMIENGLGVACDHRIIVIDELQMEGRKAITAKDFCNGVGKVLIGKRFV